MEGTKVRVREAHDGHAVGDEAEVTRTRVVNQRFDATAVEDVRWPDGSTGTVCLFNDDRLELVEPECVTGRPLRVPDFEAQVSEALAAVETGVADARGDFPEVGESDLYHEISGSIVTSYPAAVRAEVFRRLGFDAEGF